MANERYALNKQLAQMLKGGVIMDVTTPEQAKIAEEAGACAVMALERIPADIRAAGGVARMSDPKMIQEIQAAVSIPVMAKCRIGHFVEAQLLQAIEIDYIDRNCLLQIAVFLAAFKLRSVQLSPVEQRSIAIIRLHLYLNFNVNELVVHI